MKIRGSKLCSVGLAGILAISMLAGCGDGKAGNDTSGDGKAKGGSGETASVWHYFEHEAEALEKVIDEFNEMQDDIKLVGNFIARDELMNQYTIGAVSGELPDIGMVDSPDMASYISLGVFEDITDSLEEWGELDNFYPGPLSSAKDADGRIYGLPNNSNCLTMLYNMDLLEEAGFKKAPETWEEFAEVAEKTTNASENIFGYAQCLVSTEEGTFQIMPWLYGGGGSMSTLTSKESVASIDFLANLMKNGYMSKEVVNWTQGDAYNAFVAGKAASIMSGTWQIATLDDDIKDAGTEINYQYALMPTKDGKRASTIGGENFGVCTGAVNVDACVDFLKYMMSPEKNGEWCEIAGKLVVREDANEFNSLNDDERFAVFSDMMEFAVARGPHAQWPTMSEALYTSVQGAVLGEYSPKEAMEKADAVIAPILEEDPINE